MSPGGYPFGGLEGGFPRVSGDEPKTEMTENTEPRFSPRERG